MGRGAGEAGEAGQLWARRGAEGFAPSDWRWVGNSLESSSA